MRSTLLENIKQVAPHLENSQIEIHNCLSHELQLEKNARFGFIHIDGGHSKDETLGDLLLCKDHLCSGGVIALDDYMHPEFPGVTQAISEFLCGHNGFHILADLNRHGMIGRKLYLIKKGSIFPLKNEII